MSIDNVKSFHVYFYLYSYDNDRVVGSRAFFRCPSGASANVPEVRCEQNGEWSPEPPRSCDPGKCVFSNVFLLNFLNLSNQKSHM